MQQFKMNFLAAADGTALTKQYTKESDGTFTAQPYPNVRNFSSFEYDIDSIESWHAAMKAHSDLGHCYIKGALEKKLSNEPRAGRTNPHAATRTMLLDLDFNEGFRDIEDFLYQLDGGMFNNVSYIVHHSNSAGITGPVGLRAHIGLIFDEPTNVEYIKEWLKNKNLTIPALSKLLTLSANGLTLKYPLDITTCQNDKLIYIARPGCLNFDDPLEDSRIQLVKKQNDVIQGKLPFLHPQVTQDLVEAKVKELRKTAGYKEKSIRYNGGHGEQIILNPDRAVVSSVKTTSGPWTYLNLNDGDSWGYYHSTDRPYLLMNFKGEPPCRLRDIVPEYFGTLAGIAKIDQVQVPYVFRNRKRDQYYNLLYNPSTGEIDSLDVASNKDKLETFMELHNKRMPDPLEDWDIEFDPRTTTVLEERNRWVNSFRPTKYLKTDYEVALKIPYVINKVLTSICVDEEYKAWLLNWVACIYQGRDKTMTCPLFHGVQGTGKGLFQEKILMPLLGEDHCPKLTTQQIKDPFNGWTEHALVATWDEAEQNSSFDTTTYEKVKHLITEEHTTLRLMRQNPVTVRSFLNLLVFTNHPFPFPLDPNDRRFCVAPPQLTKLQITESEVDTIESELGIFAAYLQHYPVSTEMARTILYNEARTEMITGSANTVDTFFYALRDGNLDYFLSFIRNGAAMTADPIYNEFVKTLRRWGNDLERENQVVTRDEAMAVFSYIIKKYDSPAKFKKMGEKYHIPSGRGQIQGKQSRGWSVKWKCTKTELLEDFLQPADVGKIRSAS